MNSTKRGLPFGLPGQEKAGAVWVIGVSAPAVVTGIYQLDDSTLGRSYISIPKSGQNKRVNFE
jgi:hypothetical protein